VFPQRESSAELFSNATVAEAGAFLLSDSGIPQVGAQEQPLLNLPIRFLPDIHVFNAETMLYHNHDEEWLGQV